MIWVPRKVPRKFPSLILKERHETAYLKRVFSCISVCMCEGRGEWVVRELLLHTGGIRLLVSLPGRGSAYWTCCSVYLSIWWGGGEGLDRDQEVALVAGRHSQTRDGKNKTLVCPKWTLLKSKRAACWLRAGEGIPATEVLAQTLVEATGQGSAETRVGRWSEHVYAELGLCREAAVFPKSSRVPPEESLRLGDHESPWKPAPMLADQTGVGVSSSSSDFQPDYKKSHCKSTDAPLCKIWFD